jgi:hypothetical protein
LNPNPPTFLLIPLCLDHYRNERYDEALQAALRLTSEDFRIQLFRAASCGQLGREGEGRAQLEEPERLNPGFAQTIREDLIEAVQLS